MRYIDNTSYEGGETVINQIYALDDGKDPCDIPNKRLLFHGSDNRNILGILKRGLQITPLGMLIVLDEMFGMSFSYCDRVALFVY